jgi:hypothetical protein
MNRLSRALGDPVETEARSKFASCRIFDARLDDPAFRECKPSQG